MRPSTVVRGCVRGVVGVLLLASLGCSLSTFDETDDVSQMSSAGAAITAGGFRDPFPPPDAASVGAPSQPAASVLFTQGGACATAPCAAPFTPPTTGFNHGLSIEWWMTQPKTATPPVQTANANGVLFQGPGFSLGATWQESQYGALSFQVSEVASGSWLGPYTATIYLPPSDGNAHFFALTHDLHAFRAYRDGEPIAISMSDVPAPQLWVSNELTQIGPQDDLYGTIIPGGFHLGARASTPTVLSLQRATLDKMRLSNVALTPWQVRRNFENDRPYSQVLYVDNSSAASASNAGTKAAPLTLAKAISLVRPGTKLILSPGTGTYDAAQLQLASVAGTPRAPVLIEGLDGTAPITLTSSTATAPTIAGSSYVALRHLTFVLKASAASSHAALQINAATGPTSIDGCTFTGPGTGVAVHSSPNVMVENTIFAMSGTGASLEVADSDGPIVRQDTFYEGDIGVSLEGTTNNSAILNSIFANQTKLCVSLTNAAKFHHVADGNVYSPAAGANAVLIANTAATMTGVAAPPAPQVFSAADVRSHTYAHLAYYFKSKWVDAGDTSVVVFSGGQNLFNLALPNISVGGGNVEELESYRPEAKSLNIAPAFNNPAAGDFSLKPVMGNVMDQGVPYAMQSGVWASLYDFNGCPRPQQGGTDVAGCAAIEGNAVDPGAFETTGPVKGTYTFSGTSAFHASAAVFQTDGGLVRTLLSDVVENAPIATSYPLFWNGLDDDGAPVDSTQAYEFKVRTHEMSYVLQGGVGNTSTNQLDSWHFHRGFSPVSSMVITGDMAYFLEGYNEGQWQFRSFNVSNPNSPNPGPMFGPEGGRPIWTDFMTQLATDGTTLYAINSQHLSAYAATGDHAGIWVTNPAGTQSVVYGVTDTGTEALRVAEQNLPAAGTHDENILTSVTVQKSGNLLMVSRALDNRVYVYDKTVTPSANEKPVGSISVTNPGQIAADPDSGDLWVSSNVGDAGVLYRYANATLTETAPAPATTVTGLQHIVALASVQAGGAVLVVEGGTSQQVKELKLQPNGTATVAWAYGQPGGYANGPAVTNDKFGFWFHGAPLGYIAADPNGGFWVSDTATFRNLHFDHNRNYVEMFSYLPATYYTTVDKTDTTRVFDEFIEFSIDYSVPNVLSWKAENYWGWSQNGPLPFAPGGPIGFGTVATLGTRTFGWVRGIVFPDATPDPADAGGYYLMAELTDGGLRPTDLVDLELPVFGHDKSLELLVKSPAPAQYIEQTFTGAFLADGTPEYTPPTDVCSMKEGTDPLISLPSDGSSLS